MFLISLSQYDAVGWAPKEYNPDEKQSAFGNEQSGTGEAQQSGLAPQSGFVWDEKSGYYYDAASGFYYDGNTGLHCFFDIVHKSFGLIQEIVT